MLKMGVHTPEAFQPSPAGSEFFNIGYDDLLVAADQDGFVVDVEGTERRIPYRDVTSARTVFVWGKQSEPERH